MGSKHALSNGNEVEELAGLLRAFDELNGMRTAIVFCVVERGGKPRLTAMCLPMPACSLEQAGLLWGSMPYVCEAGELVKLAGLAMHAMYGLDGQMAAEEFRKNRESKA